MTDLFEAVLAIKAIPENLLEEGYRFVSFDVESLFTSVPLKRTIDIHSLLSRVFQVKFIDTTLSKRTLKKLLFLILALRLPSRLIFYTAGRCFYAFMLSSDSLKFYRQYY